MRHQDQLTRLRGRARRGARVRDHAPLRHKGTQTFVAGLRYDRLVAPWLLDGPKNRAGFDRLGRNNSRRSSAGRGRPADNPRCPKAQACRILRANGAWFLFLPPYSPDLNPIEMAFSKLKAHLRRIGARTLDALCRAVGEICGLFDPDECWNYFKEAGYVSD